MAKIHKVDKMKQMLTLDDKKQLLNNFPYVELSYEKDITHKKVQMQSSTKQSSTKQNSINMLIPKGPKAFIWFTYWNTKPVCITLPLMPNKKGINVHNIQLRYASFSKDLSLCTIMYGTFLNEKNKLCFSCEDIFYYKGIPVFLNLDQRILLICSLFRNREINSLNALSIDTLIIETLIIGLPIITSTFEEAEQLLDNLNYEVYAIRTLNADRSDLCGLIKLNTIKTDIKEGYFKVKASINEDIYHLYSYDQTNSYDNPHGIALIPTYKKSVFMNSLFRNIKENTNLDLLEESDDEDEFENANVDKFVDTTKIINMKCVYIKQFRKWEPTEVMNENVKLITGKELYQIENGPN